MCAKKDDEGDKEHLVAVLGRTISISHPNKVVFPELGATKLELVEYYLTVADQLAVTAYGRPALLQRFPNGAGGSSFFQKRVPANAPSWLRTTVVETPNGTTSNALVVEDVGHVLWAVNLGCLGLHLWPFQVGDAEHTDELRIDLDPQPGTNFEEVRIAAGHVRSLLDELGIVGYPKTSGGRGLHIYVRLAPRWSSYEVRASAVAIARELERRHPALITANWWKEERGERIFIDFNQNAPHKTIFGAWFARPRVGAQVSTPLSWDEIESVSPDALTIRTVPSLVADRGDPWSTMAEQPQSLLPLLELAAADKANGLHDAPWPPEYPKQPDEPPRVAPSRAKAP
jgi:DNA ligase D